MKALPPDPLVSHIRHFALDDGPGIRSTVFLKGCPLACLWCHNPESIDSGVQLGFDARSCVNCGACVKICPRKAIARDRQGRIDRNQCDLCLKCAEECPSQALYRVGTPYAPLELADLLLRNRLPSRDNGSGVTFSGGEPTLGMDYLGQVIAALKHHDVHIALQTCGHFDIDPFQEKLRPHIDLLHFDLKLMSSRAHRRYTGQSNRRILRNFKILREDSGLELIPTIPLVPGITATPENLSRTAAFLRQSGCRRFEFRPYHPGGHHKRRALGLNPWTDAPKHPLSLDRLSDIRSRFQSAMEGRPTEITVPGPIHGP